MSLNEHKGPPILEGIVEADYEPNHDFGWAIEQLRKGRKVTREAGLRGNRIFIKSLTHAWHYLNEDEMLATDWKLYKR